MQKNWKQEIERHNGTGTVSDASNHTAKVSYTLIVSQNMRERPSLNKPTEIVGGTYELFGHLRFIPFVSGLHTDKNLLLKLEDNREVEIILTKFSSPAEPCDFVVTDDKSFLSATK